jgi:hypothetical protein
MDRLDRFRELYEARTKGDRDYSTSSLVNIGPGQI